MRNYKSIIIMVVIGAIVLTTLSCGFSKSLKNVENNINNRNKQLEKLYKEIN